MLLSLVLVVTLWEGATRISMALRNHGLIILSSVTTLTSNAGYSESAFQDGKVSPYFISEEIPEENNEPVKVIIAYSLRDMVFKSGKNVLLEFYAPWCESCRSLDSILNEVVVHNENDSDIMIAKFDVNVNEITDNYFDVRAYPAVYFRSASQKINGVPLRHVHRFYFIRTSTKVGISGVNVEMSMTSTSPRKLKIRKRRERASSRCTG